MPDGPSAQGAAQMKESEAAHGSICAIMKSWYRDLACQEKMNLESFLNYVAFNKKADSVMLVASLHRSAVLPVERRSISGPGAETWPFRGRCWQSKCRGSLFCTVLQCFCLFLRCIESWIVLSFACLHYACTLHCFWFLFPCFVISLLVQLRGSNGFAWGFEFQARGCGKGETAKRVAPSDSAARIHLSGTLRSTGSCQRGHLFSHVLADDRGESVTSTVEVCWSLLLSFTPMYNVQ